MFDPDAGQTLTLGLGVGAPAGASINPTNNTFVWQPNSLQGPAAYDIAITATDNGAPSLSATQTFQITVADTLPDVVVSCGNCNTGPGQTLWVRLMLDTGVSVTNLLFEVAATPPLLGGFTLQSPSTYVLGASVQSLSPGRARVTLAVKGGVPAVSKRTLLRAAGPCDRIRLRQHFIQSG